jgi:hypothetical protein
VREIPTEILTRPFTLATARAAGLTARQLGGQRCRRLFQGVYLGADVEVTVAILTQAVALILPDGAVVGGATAALLRGADVRRRDDLDIDVILLREGQIRRPGIRATAAHLEPGDVEEIMGVPVTSAVRTAFDLARQQPHLIDSVVGIDAMLNRGGCCLDDLTSYIAEHRGWRGVRWADAALLHAEPKAESPMESRQRMRLVLGGLPRPEAQYVLYDGALFVARLDHGYPEWRVGPEYDGEIHETTWRADIERQERIRGLHWWHRGYNLLSIQSGWQQMVDEVGAALVAAGWRPPR